MTVAPSLLAWFIVVTAAAVLAYAAVRSSRRRALRPAGLGVEAVVAAGLLMLAALATVPGTPPFSPGGTLAPGLLIGGTAALVGVLLGAVPTTARTPDRWAGSAAQFAAPVLGVGLLLVSLPGRILWALGGFAIACAAVGVLYGGRRLGASGAEDEAPVAATAERIALAGITLAACTYLATFHRSSLGVREWQMLPGVIGVVLAGGLALRSVFPGDGIGATLVSVGATFAVGGGVCAWTLGRAPGIFAILLLGAALFLVVAWLDDRRSADEPPAWDATRGLLPALLVVGAAATAFRIQQGFGLGLLALSGTAALAVTGTHAPQRVSLVCNAVGLALLLTLYRVFEEGASYQKALEPQFFYYHAALLGGALVPTWLAGAAGWRLPGSAGVSSGAGLPRAALAGLASAVVPLAVWLLVGERPQAAFLIGLPLGTAVSGAMRGRSEGEQSLARLLGMAAVLGAVQCTPLLVPLGIRSRWERIGILGVLGIVILVGIGAAALRERRSER